MRILFTCTSNFSKSWFSFVETSTRPYNFRRASSKLFYKLTETTIESNAIFSLPPLRCWEQNNRDIETQNIPFWNRRWVQPCNYAKKPAGGDGVYFMTTIQAQALCNTVMSRLRTFRDFNYISTTWKWILEGGKCMIERSKISFLHNHNL